VVRHRTSSAFSLLEILISIAVIALLISMLLPVLSRARAIGCRAVCANNLRQMNVGWQGYIQDNKDFFPQASTLPDWQYGGVEFAPATHEPVLAADRPINRYVADGVLANAGEIATLFRCPSDAGIYNRGTGVRGRPGDSILGAGETCFDHFGNSYRANPILLDSTAAGIDSRRRPLALHEVHVDTSRLLVVGDPVWYYATLGIDSGLEASWHTATDSGHMLAVDGSIRFIDFARRDGVEYTLRPRP
jgi:type II secretory pathway pseudopilin PulG